MAFEAQLYRSLDVLDKRLLDRSIGREELLNDYLREVEAAADDELLTSILLIDASGRHLVHGAAPNLPDDYCKAIDGIEIGPEVGSCGTAAYTGHAIYVTDVETDPLWVNFRDLAIRHGLRACWSTPIFDEAGNMLGTFAIYYRVPRAPRPEEIDAIKTISRRVAQAVEQSS